MRVDTGLEPERSPKLDKAWRGESSTEGKCKGERLLAGHGLAVLRRPVSSTVAPLHLGFRHQLQGDVSTRDCDSNFASPRRCRW